MFTSRGSQFLFSLLVVTFILASAPKTTPQTATQPIPDASSRLSQQQDKPQTKEEAEALRLLKESSDLLQQGKLDEAIATGERALQVCESPVSPDPLCRAAAKIILAKLYIKKGDLARAEPLYLEAFQLFDKRLGPDQFDTVGSLSNLAETFWLLRDKRRALRMYELALTTQEAKFGPQHLDVAKLLTRLGTAYRANGNYAAAEERFIRALNIYEKQFGPDHQEVGHSLNRLGGLYRVMGEYELSVKHYERALGILEKAFGPDNTEVATVLDNLGLVYQEQGKLGLAEQTHKRALATFEKLFEPNHIDVGIALGNLASVYERMGSFDRAEEFYRRELVINEQQYGTAHPAYATTLDNFANLYQRKLDYKRAEQMRKLALEIYLKSYGPDHLDVAIALSNLALLYLEEGDYVQAERMFLQSLSIRTHAYGEKHHDVVNTLINLGSVYRLKGDYPSAMRMYRSALRVAEEISDAEDPHVVDALIGVGDIYRKIGDLGPAEKLYKRALEIHRKAYGRDSSLTIGSLASLYFERGDLVQAEQLFKQALELLKKDGENNPAFAIGLSHLAELYHMKGQYAKAEEMYLRARTIFEVTFGDEHPNIAGSLFQLSLIKWAQRDISTATHLLSRANDLEERYLTRMLPTGSESQKKLFLIDLSPMTHATLSFNANAAPRDPAATRLALTTVLRRKGRALDAMTDETGALRRRLDPQDKDLFDRLSTARTSYAAMAGTVSGNSSERRAQLLKLQDQIESLEAQAGRRSSELRITTQAVTIEKIQTAVPAGAVLVELVAFTTYNAKANSYEGLYGANKYAAYVLGRTGDPVFVDLGDAERIDRAVTRLRASLRNPASTDTKPASRALDELIMQPIRKHLGAARTILVSPDGALNLVPFDAFVDEQGRYLIENYTVIYLTSGRDLLRLQTTGQSRDLPKIFANPLYDLTASRLQPTTTSGLTNLLAGPNANNRRSRDFADVSYRPLPGTAAEAEAIGRILPEASLAMQQNATERAVKMVNRPLILHIATHGYFLSKQSESSPVKTASRGTVDTLNNVSTGNGSENPLLRSGLILAGIKQGQSGPGEDGVLTALEVSGLDLWGTKLVVLSACETGLGDVKNGEGVYGLRRALVLAGSETQVMSLWKVSDAGTRDLMTAYYTRLKNDEGRAEALRQVQLEMLRGQLKVGGSSEKRGTTDTGLNPRAKDYRHPYYWAAFIQSGDWRSLNGKQD
jgi:CHAT domain-containing protein/Tfp pilus assembly protein PilF